MASKKQDRQDRLLNLLRNQGHRVINISNSKMATLLGTTVKTVQRDINDLVDKEFIVKETHLINDNGETKKQRDIILNEYLIEEEIGYFKYKPILSEGVEIGKEGRFIVTGTKKKLIPQRRFTLSEHKNLSDKSNHKIVFDGSEFAWYRRPEGEGSGWQRSMEEKQFTSEKQIWSWIYPTLSGHHNRYTSGDKYVNRGAIS